MKIAVIGTGNIGGSLGTKWRAAGYDVTYGSRSGSAANPAANPAAEPAAEPGTGPGGAPVLPVGEALAGADVVVLAVPGQAVPDVISAHAAALAGKIVIDASNRMGEPEVNSRALITGALPDARYVRAFNSYGWENFADPLPGVNLFFAADPTARSVVEELIAAVGLEPAFLGEPDVAGTVDSVTSLWFALVRQHDGHRRVALRVVTED